MPNSIQRIGVMCSPALGDTLLFSAPVQDVRKAFPHAHITHLCMPQNIAAAELIEGIDQRIIIDLTQVQKSVKTIRDQRFDLLLDFTSWQRLTAFYTLMSGAKFTIGFTTKGQYRGRGYDLQVEHRNDRHEVENLLSIPRAIGIETRSAPHLVIPEAPEPLPGGDDIVIFHLWPSGNRGWLREWPEERWIALAHRLAQPDTLFVVTGAPSDLPRSRPFAQRMQAAGLRAEPYISPDGFVSLSHLLRRARMAVSVNTGVMHLAAILGTPTISLNGPTAPHRWGPTGPQTVNVQPLDGSGGYLNLGFEFPSQPENVMQKIHVDEVVKATQTLAYHCRS